MSRRIPRSGWLIALGVVAMLAVAILLQDGARSTTPLDPDNPGGTGLRALSRVLEDTHQVEIARDAQALAAAEPDADTVVVVTHPDQLGSSTVRRLRADAAQATVLLLDPGTHALDLFGLDPDFVPAASRTLSPRCDDPRFDGIDLAVDWATFHPGAGCFTDGQGRSVLVAQEGVVVFGAATALTNDQILTADNAALGLRLLGSGDRVLWYVPSAADLSADDAIAPRSLVPPWAAPTLVLAAAALLAVMVWRGRRFGPLAVEPLPVRVRASETTVSRGRLYQRARDRGHAAQVLREATLESARRHLGLGPSTDSETVRAIAARTSRTPDEVGALLSASTTPATDSDLTTLAAALAALEKEIRTP